jgi:putative phosphoribosyl transferase
MPDGCVAGEDLHLMAQRSTGSRTGAVNSIVQPAVHLPEEDSRFADRHDAGRRLAALAKRFRDEDPVVVGIPRGGVPVAAEVARALDAPLDVVVVRKIGAPGNPEYGIGALAEGGVSVVSQEAVEALGLGSAELDSLIARTQRELDDRLRRYRGDRTPLPVEGRTVLLVDDGLATGRTAKAAAQALRRRGAQRVILAIPVAAPGSVDELRDSVDEVVSVQTPPDLWAIGFWYDDFRPTSDEEVAALLGQSAVPDPPPAHEIVIEATPGIALSGDLALPKAPRGLVVFAHGSGSSRLSPRNRAVAGALNQAGLGTLLFDLLTPSEEVDRANVFDIPLLAERLVAVARWLGRQPRTEGLAVGFFGASTGAAAALIAAAELGPQITAVVSRGGRPDLAAPRLAEVASPTLLIVGGADRQVLELNRQAQQQLRCPNELAIVPRATHLFEEPGALEAVSRLAIDWFLRHPTPPTPSARVAGPAAHHP